MTSPTPEQNPPRGMRVPFVAGALVTGLLAVVLMLVGGAALVANGEKDSDGYLTTDSERFATGRAAIATDNLDVDLDGAGAVLQSDDLGKVRLKVTSQSGKPVFAGIARTADVDAYLGAVAHTTLTDVDVDPFVGRYQEHGGARRAAAPATRSIWSASTSGTGTRTLSWDIADGNWSVVVMNADGSPGVAANVSAGAEAPWLTAFGWSTLGGGVLLLLATGGLLAAAARPRRPRPVAPSTPSPAPAS